MCDVLLPPSVKPIAVKYISSSIITDNYYAYKMIFPQLSEDNKQESKNVKQEKKEAICN
jgi:hypothetical protein